jgi:glycosyltransferase involved in cell wall biosynthesis
MKYDYLIFEPSKDFGGLEIQMLKRATDILDAGRKCLLLCTANTRVEEYAEKWEIPYENVEIKTDYFDIAAARKIGKYARRLNNPICLLGKTKYISIALVARMMFYEKMSIILYQHMQSGLKKKDIIHNWVYRNLDGAIVLTPRMKKQLGNTTVFPASKIKVVQHGIAHAGFHPGNFSKRECRRKFGLPEDKFIFGYVARIDRHKDQLTALKAFREVDDGSSLLVFCGHVTNEDYDRELIRFINENDMNERVVFLGFTDDIPEVMNSFDCFVMPSSSETFGLVILEAMASGLPVIACGGGGVPAIVEDGKNGLLFEAHDYKKLAAYMRRMMEDKAFATELALAGLHHVHENNDYQKQVSMLFDYCEEIHEDKFRKK